MVIQKLATELSGQNKSDKYLPVRIDGVAFYETGGSRDKQDLRIRGKECGFADRDTAFPVYNRMGNALFGIIKKIVMLNTK